MAVIHWDRPAEAGRPSCGHCRSLTDLAGPEASERHAEAIAFAERAIELATTLGLPAPARALGLRGSARFAPGDAGGLNDTRRVLEAALGQGLGRETVVLYNNLAEDLGRAEGTAGTAGAGAPGRGLHPAAGDRRMGAAARRPDRAGAG
jgi:hypothetical protein